MENARVTFRAHAVQRMFQRNVSVKSVLRAVRSGDIVEDYSSEMPEPSRLLLGFQGTRPFHLVIAESSKTNEIVIITVYLPDPGKWNDDFASRRS